MRAATYNWEKDTAENSRGETLLWWQPATFGIELFAVPWVLVKDRVGEGDHEPNQDT